ncbi:aldehyde dehydrogenase family protein [Cryobacterium mannosilyticum]|uniref:Aldehyde dehydrogenase family protein n=1 Tax=Cryobacterium mannosilyticum TaxID=1259190 RepID=A0A4R8W709_9MICO|nr:aldehyde dehydrogenase family protein [Cryobacterium mannosilyticum]TFC01543.1 aldehyde dehydrogenase family protein [Cryobacterium mannosilyticum]
MTVTEPSFDPTSASPSGAGLAPDTAAGQAELDALIAELAAGEQRWARTPLPERVGLLRAVHAAVAEQAENWVRTASEVKGLDAASSLVGEEWISGPYPVLTATSTLAGSVARISRGESPLAGSRFGTAPGNRVTVQVLPHSAHESVLLHGFRAEVWMPPGVTADTVRAQAGLAELHPAQTRGVGLVLGAGNITSIPPLDVLYELIANNRVVLLKLNPVLARMLPVYQAALAPLVRHGVLRIVTGDGDVGGYLAHHAGISHVHITGSAATHDTVVFGRGAAGTARKAAGSPVLAKPITSELGGVAPIILLPGRWTRRDLRYQAEHVATQRLHNGGYNCIAGQVVVLSRDWPQKDAFLAELRDAIGRAPARPAWYPGSEGRVAAAAAAYPFAERLGDGGRLLVVVGDGDDPEPIRSTETFSPVLGVVELPGTGASFLDAAIDTVNRDFLGTLGANVIAEPRTIRALGHGFRDALARLRYGTIAINTWTGLGFLTAAAPWGAYPGHTLGDVQSGIGVVHNALLIDSPERTVVSGPFRPFPRSVAHGEFALFPKPPWFVSARSAATTGRLLAGFAARPSWLRMPRVFAAAFRA